MKLHWAVFVCSSLKSVQCLFFLFRITPPFHTSSPEHQKYTPPSASRKGRLFDGDEFLTKNAAGPRNLLEVIFFLMDSWISTKTKYTAMPEHWALTNKQKEQRLEKPVKFSYKLERSTSVCCKHVSALSCCFIQPRWNGRYTVPRHLSLTPYSRLIKPNYNL